jgi:P-type conjugative transfer protein TrbG
MYRPGMLLIVSVFLVALGCGSTHEVGKPAREVTPEQTIQRIVIPTVQPVPEKTTAQNGKTYVQEKKKVPSEQLKKIESTRTVEQDPAAVIATAQKKAAQNPSADRYINAITVYDYMDGALYQIYTAPNHITDIMLQPGEVLTGQPAGGDTVRWTVGVSTSKSGSEKTYHILVQPKLPALQTNMVLMTDRHTYHLEFKSFKETYQAAVSWRYPQDDLTKALRMQEEEESRTIANVKVSDLNFRYNIQGDASWRPVRVFDDGAKTYIEFPGSVQRGELPPLFIVSKDSNSQLVNYRYRNNYYIVDRLFQKALLMMGNRSSEKVYITRQ